MQQAASLQRLHKLALAALLRGGCPYCTATALPIIGEVPKHALDSQQRFWLETDQSRVPPPYRHTGHAAHLDSLPTIYAAPREDTGYPLTGSWAARKLRGLGFTPALLDSLPMGQAPRHLIVSTGQINTAFRQFGATLTNRLMLLHVVTAKDVALFNQPADDARAWAAAHGMPAPQHTFQVLARRLSVNSNHGDLEGVTLMHCPSTRVVESKVPVVEVHADESPAARRGGFALVVKKNVRVRSLAANIPLTMPIDCVAFDAGAKVFARDLQLGPGQQLVGVHPDTCILKMELAAG